MSVSGKAIETTANHPYLVRVASRVAPMAGGHPQDDKADGDEREDDGSKNGVELHRLFMLSNKQDYNGKAEREYRPDSVENEEARFGVKGFHGTYDFAKARLINQKAKASESPAAMSSSSLPTRNGLTTIEAKNTWPMSRDISESASGFASGAMQSYYTFSANSVNGLWVKVAYLRPGMGIAVAGEIMGYKKLGPSQLLLW